jgi:hypothetical protein
MSNVMVPRTPSMAEHAANIGWIVRCLALHQPGDWGDCAINDAVVSIIDERRPAHELVAALAAMDFEMAAGIVAQCGGILNQMD